VHQLPFGVEIVPERQLGGILTHSTGHDVFVLYGKNRMNVGVILPYGEGRFLLNIMIMKKMSVPDYELCDFSESFETYEAAVEAASKFLRSKLIVSAEVRMSVEKLTQSLLREHDGKPQGQTTISGR